MRVKFILNLLSVCLMPFLGSAQNINWANCYGGTGADGAGSIIHTSDGGSLVLGSTYSNDGDVSGNHLYFDTQSGTYLPSQDVWALKLDAIGNIQWQKCYGGSGIDVGTDVIETTDGYVISAMAGSNDGDISFSYNSYDFWVIKIDWAGNIIWEKCYGGYSHDEPRTILKTLDNGFIVTGHELSPDGGDVQGHHGTAGRDIWIIKIDSVGTLLWQKCLGGSWSETYGFSTIDTGGNIYISGITGSTDGDVTCTNSLKEGWLVKLDSSGNILWDRCYGGSGIDEFSYIEVRDDKLLISSTSSSSDYDLTNNYGYRDVWVILADTAGNIIFSRNYGGSSTEYGGVGYFIYNSSEMIIVGNTGSTDQDITFNHGFWDAWVIKLDSIGNIQWQKCYGGTMAEGIGSFFELPGNAFQFAAYTTTNNDGDVTGFHMDSLGTGYGDVWIVNLNVPTGINDFEQEQQTLQVQPNPFSNTLSINFNNLRSAKTELTLFDVLGNIVDKIILNTNTSLYYQWPLAKLANGIYIIEAKTEKGMARSKVIKN